MKLLITSLLFVLVAPLAFAGAQGLTGLRVLPESIRLDHAHDTQRVTVIADYDDGTTRDVTGEAKITMTDGEFAEVAGGVVAPVSDGTTLLEAAFEGRLATAQVIVRNTRTIPPVSFLRDVVPVLTRQGCNAGGCHGAATGKGGFRLSLFGYDPDSDWRHITRELRGRRLAPHDPDESLLLAKPTTRVTHKGGQRLAPDTPSYATLLNWISEGASQDKSDGPTLTGIRILPSEAALAGSGRTQQVIVIATYDDGTDADVTELSLFSSSNPGSAAVDGQGQVTSGSHGEAFVMARFGTFAEVSQILVLDPARPMTWPAGVEPEGEIDRHLFAKMRKMRVTPPERCSDEVYVRRVYLDVINLLPTPEDVRSFVADPSPDKRARLVDTLLERPEFADVGAMQWAEVLRLESFTLQSKGMQQYTEYLKAAFRDRTPFDQVVRELITAKGGNFESAPANFFLVERNPKPLAEHAAQAFLGIRIQCAQCHNHPFERWTMDDYYGFAAFFAQVATKRGDDPRELVVYDRGAGEMRHPNDNRVMAPRFLGGVAPTIAPEQDRREVLAAWLTSPDNPWFANNLANRVFARFFGRGLVDPPDDVRISNPPSHPELYRYLGSKLAEDRYDIRPLIRSLTASLGYQAQARSDEVPAGTFAGGKVQRLTAEQLLDAIAQVTDVPVKYRGLPEGARAFEVSDGNPQLRFLDIFGRPRRASACTCDRRGEPTLTQALHLINGETVEARIRNPEGRLRRLLAAKTAPEAILEEIWVAAYARPPTPDEKATLLPELHHGASLNAWTDLLWAVLNSKEFLFNH
jgi:hypothetical protein